MSRDARPLTRGALLARAASGVAAASAAALVGPDVSSATSPDLAAHEAATTSVHGIADTSVLAKYTGGGRFSAPQTFSSGSRALLATSIRGAGSQNAHLSEWRDASDNVLAYVDAEGGVRSPHMAMRQFDPSPNVAPEMVFSALNGSWLSGIDVAARVPARDLVLAAKVSSAGTGVTDFIYAAHRGTSPPVVGMGWVSPPYTYRLAISPEDSEPSMGGLGVRVATTQKGHAFALLDSATESPRFWIDSSYYLSRTKIKGDPNNVNQTISFSRSNGGNNFAFQYADNGALMLKYTTSGNEALRFGGDGRMRVMQTANMGAGAQFPHVGSGTPTGGTAGELRVGSGKLWFNDNGTWRSQPIS